MISWWDIVDARRAVWYSFTENNGDGPYVDEKLTEILSVSLAMKGKDNSIQQRKPAVEEGWNNLRKKEMEKNAHLNSCSCGKDYCRGISMEEKCRGNDEEKLEIWLLD